MSDQPARRERSIPIETGVVPPRPEAGGGSATPSFALPEGAGDGLPRPLGETRIGPRTFHWGERTLVVGILNVTPDSFSGDGLLRTADPIRAAVDQAIAMVEDGADVLDVGGESSRPGHDEVSAADEIGRVVPVIGAIRAALPDVPLSIDTIKPSVADAAIDAGAHLVNDVWGVADDDALVRVASERGIPVVLMHNRAAARYTSLMPEIVADLQRAIERALRVGIPWSDILVDPGFGFGKTPEHNLTLLRELGSIRMLGRPILLGTSRKSTLGKVLDLPPEERIEATLATTALAIASGVDLVRVHDVRPNVRVARMADAVVRGWHEPAAPARGDARP